jgi:hypothetical protein
VAAASNVVLVASVNTLLMDAVVSATSCMPGGARCDGSRHWLLSEVLHSHTLLATAAVWCFHCSWHHSRCARCHEAYVVATVCVVAVGSCCMLVCHMHTEATEYWLWLPLSCLG